MENKSTEQLFQNSSIYSTAFCAALRLFELSRNFPQDGSDSLYNSIRKSSSGVCLNINKALQNTNDEEIFVAKLNDAAIEAIETQDYVEFAIKQGYLRQNKGEELNKTYEHIIEEIVSMIKEPE